MRDHLVFGRRRGHPRQPIQLARRDLVGSASGSWASSTRLRSSLDLVGLAFAELVLDRLAAAGAGSPAAARPSSPAAPATRSCPSPRGARSRAPARPRPSRASSSEVDWLRAASASPSAGMSSRLRQQVGEPQRIVDASRRRRAAPARSRWPATARCRPAPGGGGTYASTSTLRSICSGMRRDLRAHRRARCA